MGKKVLVVDDSATVRQQVRMALEQADFEVLEAVDGAQGLEQILGTSDLSVVICDVNMPKLNGLEMLDAVRPLVSKLPVIMLTTEGQPALMQRAKAAGARGWIVKPFKPNLLIAAVQKLAA
jgi:two-component system, chemotaxis family, chemotaxis protein CheY